MLFAACIAGACFAGGDLRAQQPAVSGTIDFTRDVRPVLAARCFKCHGPEKQESGLRLDRRESLFAGGDSGEPAVVAKHGDQSPLIRRVTSSKEDERMPPEGDPLSDKEIAVLRGWIDAGAIWPVDIGGDDSIPKTDFWSFQPLKRSAPPAMADEWILNPVDAFILDRLKQAGLAPSPAAEPATLIRRLYLDVLGLPPTPAQIAEYVNDVRPDAFAQLVERVLADPHYGETWARHWLDVVRFAETDGFETNVERPNAYHYRDYVIAALNDDKPYDRFVVEQLAGDMLGEDAATGFLVGGPCDKVKSPDAVLTAMQRQDELSDMINTTGAAFLGLTVGCAKCHSHKFDPIPQTDFYALQAVFAGVEHGERPLANADAARSRRIIENLRDEAAALETEIQRLGVREAVNPERNAEDFEPIRAQFVRFEVTATADGTEPCLDELEIYQADAVAGSAAAASEKNLALASNGAQVAASGTYAGSALHQLAHINDGRYGNSRSWISDTPGRGWVLIKLSQPAVIGRVVWGRDREKKFSDRLAVDYTVSVAAGEAGPWQTVASSGTRVPFGFGTSRQTEAGFAHLNRADRQRAKDVLNRLNIVNKRLGDLTASTPKAYAGVFGEPKPTHRLHRGDPMSPREVVAPGGIRVLGEPAIAADAREADRRMALAKWIVRPENPLAGRVIVSRLWQHHFGRGIVDTPSDFGRNGARPTHPELLDWLSVQLLEGGWSLKRVHRLILTSATYRQSLLPDARSLAVDADTRLLWRFPPRRLDAEAIRDSILATSGVLDTSMGGPGFSLFEPNNNYVRVYTPKESFGPAEWRRMIYMHNVRMERDAVFGPFDCPDAGQMTAARSRSTTAIQSLNLFNSRFIVEQADIFARRLEREAGADAASQIRLAFAYAFGREPRADEQWAAIALVDAHGLEALCRALFNANEFLFIP